LAEADFMTTYLHIYCINAFREDLP